MATVGVKGLTGV